MILHVVNMLTFHSFCQNSVKRLSTLHTPVNSKVYWQLLFCW